MHISVVSFLNPYKINPDGGSEDIRRRLSAIAQNHPVHLYVLDKGERLKGNVSIPEGINAHFYRRDLYLGPQSLIWPYPVLSRYNGALVKQLSADLAGNGGLLICEGLQVFSIYRSLPKQVRDQCKTVLRVHNIESRYHVQMARTEKSIFKRLAHSYTAGLYKLLESYAYKEFDVLHCISTDEMKVLQAQIDTSVSIRPVPPLVAAGMVTPNRPEPKDSLDVCMFGDYTLPVNKSGAEWFLNNVWPHVPGNFRLHIAGKNSKVFSGFDAEIHGFVDDMDHFLAKMHFVAIPVLHGAGVKIKTIDAIASGVPVIATNHAVTGLPDSVVSSVFSSDEPQEHVKYLKKSCQYYDAQVERAATSRTALLEYCDPENYRSEIRSIYQVD